MTNQNSPTRGGKRALIATLIAANLVMLVIGILTIPPNLREAAGNEPSVPGAEQTAPVTPLPEEEAPLATTESGGIPAPEETDVSLSTEERPDLENFYWYTEDVQYNGLPSDASAITNLETLKDSWKALIIYDPDNAYDSYAMEFLNIDLAGAAEDLSITLDWYLILWGNNGESFDETDMEDTVFKGQWDNGGLWASGAGTIHLTQFYEQNGKQYSVGTMDTPDGTPALVALVRP